MIIGVSEYQPINDSTRPYTLTIHMDFPWNSILIITQQTNNLQISLHNI